MSYIYKTTNLVNNKIYIGQSVMDSESSTQYLGSGTSLKRAIAKYGKTLFKKEIIVEGNFNENLLDTLEKHYIRIYAPPISKKSYNIQSGGSQFRNRKHWRAKQIYQWNLNGQLINTFISAKDAGAKLNIGDTSIYKLIKNKGRSRKLNCLFSTEKRYHNVRTEHTGKKCYLFDEFFKLIKSFKSQKACAKYIKCNEIRLCYAIQNRSLLQNKYYVSNSSTIKFASSKKNNHNIAIALYNNRECLLFKTCSEATNYLKKLYSLNVSSNIIQKALKSKLKFKDYNVRTLWQPINIIADKTISNRYKPIIAYNEDGSVYKKFTSIHEAAEFYNIPYWRIKHAKNKNILCQNKYWKYEEK